MRATLIFLVTAYAEVAIDGAPTFDPEELDDYSLLDEYAADPESPEARILQTLVNSTNTTVPETPEQSIPLIPLALVGLGAAGAAAYFCTRPGYTYETHEYDHAADSGLLDHPDYDLEYDDGSDYE